MKGSLTILRTDKVDPETREIYAAPGHLDLRDIVGGFIEMVPQFSTYQGKPCAVFCDEEGKLKGKPVNLSASMAWRMVTPFIDDILCGDVVIVQGDEELMEAL